VALEGALLEPAENLRYLNYVADKFDLRQHMQFNSRVLAAHWDEPSRLWRLTVRDEKEGSTRELTCRFVIMTLGLLSQPTLPRLEGMDSFKGPSFHTYYWPQQPVELAGKKVAVIGTGATAIQVIGEIADKVGELTVFQRRPTGARRSTTARSQRRRWPTSAAATTRSSPPALARRRLRARARPPGLLRGEPRGTPEALGQAARRAGLRHLARQLPRDLHR